ncbi:hypothetical protein PIB30_079974 [Stylosanthes scabra]|uniref:Uncharacterized protein n=1 Tax=Stylosanthes scabra TaxID=79078 RepID=A0ABU6TS09_9FABA|nr:hypothetical protein [Stylosanthes scabra]
MQKIGEVWGRVGEIEEEKEGHFSNFRVRIVSNPGPTIRALAIVMIGDDTFEIFVREVGETTTTNTVVNKESEQLDKGCKGLEVVCNEEEMGGDEKEMDDGEGNDQHLENTGKVVTAEEDDELKVGETQPVRSEEDEAIRNGSKDVSPIEIVDESTNLPSPTKTKTPTTEVANKADLEPDSSSLSAPPGFEKAIPIAAVDGDNGKQIERKSKKTKQNRGREVREEVEAGNWSSSEDEIECSEEETEEIWRVTRPLGAGTFVVVVQKVPYPLRTASGRFKRGVTWCNQNTE